MGATSGQARLREDAEVYETGSPRGWDAQAVRRCWATAYEPNPLIYWPDMLLSALVGWTAFAFAASGWFGLALTCLAGGVATLALLRAVLFIHELAHLRRSALPGFETVWNLLVGIPLGVPSLMYVGPHGEHHNRSVFGTGGDPEYQPMAHWRPLRILAAVLPLLFVPALLALRWAVLGPISYLVPPLRRLVVRSASTLVINPTYQRRAPRGRDRRRWRLEEAGAALWSWSALYALYAGWISWRWPAAWYLVAVGVLLTNHIRTLAAHRYENDLRPLDLTGQYLDSVNIAAGSWITVLAAPVGLRYHALHHLLPSVPYHSLGEIHRTLMAEAPAESWYRVAEARGILETARDLLRRALARGRARTSSGEPYAAV